MERRHRFVYWVQFLLLVFIILGLNVERTGSGLMLLLVLSFFLSEFFLLHIQNKIKPEKIYYRKSCFFAMVDLLAVFIFMVCLVNMLCNYFLQKELPLPEWLFPAVVIYTHLRKFYIYKNFSYEK